jgi:hypothetical protein
VIASISRNHSDTAAVVSSDFIGGARSAPLPASVRWLGAARQRRLSVRQRPQREKT